MPELQGWNGVWIPELVGKRRHVSAGTHQADNWPSGTSMSVCRPVQHVQQAESVSGGAERDMNSCSAVLPTNASSLISAYVTFELLQSFLIVMLNICFPSIQMCRKCDNLF